PRTSAVSRLPSPVFLPLPRRPPSSPLFPYTTLFRSRVRRVDPQPACAHTGMILRVLVDQPVQCVPADQLLRLGRQRLRLLRVVRDRKSTRLNSSHVSISYAVFCLKKKTACGNASSRR